jgi:hypothetical protein
MKITTELLKLDGRVLCRECAFREAEDATWVRIIRPGVDAEPLVCEACGAELRIICPNCGNFHLNPALDLDAQARHCLDQERISIDAERLEFYNRWL